MASPIPVEFQPKSALQQAYRVGLQAGGIGVIAGAIKNAVTPDSRTITGYLTRFGSTVGFFTAVGMTFAATEAVVANQRRKDDHINGAAGACAVGFLFGIRARSLPKAVASCAFLGGAMGTFQYNGNLQGDFAGKDEKPRSFFKQPINDAAKP